MGEITDPTQHAADAAQLRVLSDMCPVYSRHLSHHIRNPLASIVGYCDLAQRDLEAGNIEAMQNHLARIMCACEHLKQDLKEAGL